MKEMQELIEALELTGGYLMTALPRNQKEWMDGIPEIIERADRAIAAARSSEGGWIDVERIAKYVEAESECLMPIVVEETKHDYGVRLLKAMADEIRAKFAPPPSVETAKTDQPLEDCRHCDGVGCISCLPSSGRVEKEGTK
jgi:hypothetical protein